MRPKKNWIFKSLILPAFSLLAVFPPIVTAQGGHSQFVGGPWEILVKMGSNAEAPGLTFPFSVDDENKAQPLDQVLPILGTPMRLQLKNYCPDLKWDTNIVEQKGAGTVAKLALGGDNLDQVHWLTTDDPARSAIRSKGVGSVTIKKFQNEKTVRDLIKQLNQGDILGILSVARAEGSARHDFIIRQDDEMILEGSPYKITVLKYFPHYSLDTATGKATNASDKPMNPAVLVKVDDGRDSYEQWLWEKFPLFSHQKTQRPLSMEFHRFDLEKSKFNYILIVAPKTQSSIMFFDGQNVQAKPVNPGSIYPFTGNYFFQIEKVFEQSVITKSWKNNRDMLLNPALIATMEENESTREMVLPLNKPYHYKSDSGTILFLFKPSPKQ